MTKEETIKGLECCTNPNTGGCEACPFKRFKWTCQQDLMACALDLLVGRVKEEGVE